MKLHMAARSRFSTSTVIDSEYLVPWLSAEGPLAYSPTKPPARDYFFQYTWSNIRITTFFAGESEAKIVDPSRISEVQAVGCEVDFALQ
jgi:hypothetical protein